MIIGDRGARFRQIVIPIDHQIAERDDQSVFSAIWIQIGQISGGRRCFEAGSVFLSGVFLPGGQGGR